MVDRSRVALVVTGWDERWAAAVTGRWPVTSNIVVLAGAADHRIVVSHEPGARAPRSGPDTEVALADLGAMVLHAGGIDAFYASSLEHVLRHRGVDCLLLAGYGLETTVHSTLRRANDMGMECLVVVDACAPVDPSLVPSAVSMVEMSGGIFGAVGTTTAVLAFLGGTPINTDRQEPPS